MSYRVEIPRSAGKQIDDLPRDVQRRVVAKLGELPANPRPPWAMQLTGLQPPTWRFRVGDYRVLYDVDDDARLVTVRKVAHRREVYR